MNTEKLRAREQWGKDPCGAIHGRKHDLDTREFFDAVEHHRYQEYAPWMPEVMGFDEFAGAQLRFLPRQVLLRLIEGGCRSRRTAKHAASPAG